MSGYPPPYLGGPDYSVAYYPNPPHPTGSEQYNRPAPFPVDDSGPIGQYPPPGPGQYPPPGPGQYPPPGPGQYPPPGPGQHPFPGHGQHPPQGHGQYPPPGPGQYPPSGSRQYPPPRPSHYPPPYDQEYGPPAYGNEPIVNQPTVPMGGDWMAIPQGIPNCPPGLEYLISLSKLFVKQKVEFLEALTGFETNNKYTVKNERGEKMYWAVEDSDLCTRMFCGQIRPMEIQVFDAQKKEVIHMHRKLACAHCCFPCCLQEMEVFAPPGNLVGTIKQNWSICYPQFSVKDASGTTVLKIQGPLCAAPLCGQAEFQVLSKDKQVRLGKISKEWSGFARELFTDADFFGISFPVDLDVRMKAVMLGACILIDVMYFERSRSH